VSSAREWGDFQTPPKLVREILDTVWTRHAWGRILEPTCGRGNFLVAARERGGDDLELKGFEIQPSYVSEAKRLLADRQYVATVEEANIFDLNLATIAWSNDRPILVVGNPPWVTNSELSVLGSTNTPFKSNFKSLAGYAARTGSANFDIAEFVLLKTIKELAGQVGTIALLCKRGVARNALEFASKSGLEIDRAALYEVDASKWFNAAVDACLFVCDLGSSGSPFSAEAFTNLGDVKPSAQMRMVSGHLIEDVSVYAGVSEFEGSSPLEWRQGIKHDVSAIAELRADDANVLRNGLGELVEVEGEWTYPLLKSSDVFNSRFPARRRVVVTQRGLRDDTISLALNAPKLWGYLQRHALAFRSRKSSIYRNRPDFAMFGIGPYTFAPYKVAVSGMYKPTKFRLLGSQEGRPMLLDDTCYFLPFTDAMSAAVVFALLSSDEVSRFLRAVTVPGAKRPVTKRILQRIDLRKVLQVSGRHEIVALAKGEYERVRGCVGESESASVCLERLENEWGAPPNDPR
jgi:hypothetical protein